MSVLCYIASPSYSGSTLLTFMLGTHPGLATVGELKGRLYASLDVPKHCSCGEPLSRCPFWQRVAEECGRRGLPFDLADLDTYFHAPSSWLLDRLLRARVRGDGVEAVRDLLIRLTPGARRELSRLVERNSVLVDVIRDLQGGEVFLDSSKDAVRLKFLRDSGRFDLRVIHLLRDGRGTANSYLKRDRFPMTLAARRWRTAHEAFESITRRMPTDAVMRLRYEDLATRPEESLAPVLAFLNLPQEGACFDFRTREHHIFGNPMRLLDSDEITLDEAWRAELGTDDLAAFDRVAGEMNRRFGYA